VRTALYILLAGFLVTVSVVSIMLEPVPPLPESYAVDQCIRREVFNDCITAPTRESESPLWRGSTEDTLRECDDIALKMSVRLTSVVPVECRGVAP